MVDAEIARALHVLSIVLWIGGVSFVTLSLLPYIRADLPPENAVDTFEAMERRFALQAKITIGLAGITGFWMVYRYDMWDRFLDVGHWWMHAMVAVWAIFSFVVFIAEPLFLHRWFEAATGRDPVKTLALIARLHVILLTVSLITVFGAVYGVHG